MHFLYSIYYTFLPAPLKITTFLCLQILFVPREESTFMISFFMVYSFAEHYAANVEL